MSTVDYLIGTTSVSQGGWFSQFSLRMFENSWLPIKSTQILSKSLKFGLDLFEHDRINRTVCLEFRPFDLNCLPQLSWLNTAGRWGEVTPPLDPWNHLHHHRRPSLNWLNQSSPTNQTLKKATEIKKGRREREGGGFNEKSALFLLLPTSTITPPELPNPLRRRRSRKHQSFSFSFPFAAAGEDGGDLSAGLTAAPRGRRHGEEARMAAPRPHLAGDCILQKEPLSS